MSTDIDGFDSEAINEDAGEEDVATAIELLIADAIQDASESRSEPAKPVNKQVDKQNEIAFRHKENTEYAHKHGLDKLYRPEEVADAERVARIKALTDVDNLNLLNDSDEWHEYYLAQLSLPQQEGGEQHGASE